MPTKRAQDISDSLGKLPPQAPEMEEAVIGALMLESGVIEQVEKFLKPAHFYVESHKIIYESILHLRAEQNPIDMKTVVAQLRKDGKLELIGGAYKIAELTSKVSSATNIEYHSRIIIEMGIKRFLIQIASKIHHDAYDDTSDVFDLLQNAEDEVLAVKKNSTRIDPKDRIKDQWAELLVVAKPADVPPLIMIQKTPVASPGNISLIVGKKKSRKSLFVVWEIAEMFRHQHMDPKSVCIFDTEQGRPHVWKYGDRIKRLSKGYQVPIFTLMGKTPEERRDFIDLTVEHWPVKIRLIVIDGIRDMMHDINDSRESSLVVTWIQKLMLRDIHIINVLHQNKADKNPRGHIGSELTNKAEATIEIELFDPNDPNSVSIVKCESSREKPFESWAFTHSDDDLPLLVANPSTDGLPEDEQRSRLAFIFKDGPMKRAALVDLIREHFTLGETKAGHKIAELNRKGWLVKSGADRSPNSVYKLMISENGHDPEPPPPELLEPLESDQVDIPFE